MALELMCDLCDKKFSRRYNLKRHYSAVHPEKKFSLPVKKCVSLKCGICKENCCDFESFRDHVFKSHDTTLHIEKLEFENESEFYCWKKTIEDKYDTLFVKNTGKNMLANKSVVINFQCHRSGYFMSKVSSNRKREIKIQGSSKINAYCPCRMKTTFCHNGKIMVDFCKTHIGHKNELEHMSLPFNVRKTIAEKIALRIPFNAILDELRSTAFGDKLKRKHFITRHDLYNIEKEFNLKTDGVRQHSNNTVSINDWINKEKQSDNSCIIVHKPQGVFVSEYPNLNKNDFLLGIMTDAQVEILTKNCNYFICIDSTHREMAFSFDLVSLFVLDDSKRGFPCAFFISNRIDDEGLKIFYQAIKNKIGIINAKVFLSNTNKLFYNVWRSVMTVVDIYLFCTWHVEQDWKKNISFIKNVSKKQETYKLVKTLLEEPDENNFQAMLTAVSQQLCVDEETKDFGEYFQSQYQYCFQSWASCYRQKLGIDSNVNLEQMHQTIKYLYLKGKTLDKAIETIMHMLKNKFFDYLTVLEKGERIAKLKDLRIRHNKSLYMSTDLVFKSDDVSWKIASSSKLTLQYIIRLVEPNCDCSISCKHCNTCIHKYSCTCVDACIKWNMCKHIHLLCRALATNDSNNFVVSDNTTASEFYGQICSDALNPDEMCTLSEEPSEEVPVLEVKEQLSEILDIKEHIQLHEIQSEKQEPMDETVQFHSESSNEQLYLLQQVSFNNLIESSSLLELKFDLVKQFSNILNNASTIDEINSIKHHISCLPLPSNSFQHNSITISESMNENIIIEEADLSEPNVM